MAFILRLIALGLMRVGPMAVRGAGLAATEAGAATAATSAAEGAVAVGTTAARAGGVSSYLRAGWEMGKGLLGYGAKHPIKAAMVVGTAHELTDGASTKLIVAPVASVASSIGSHVLHGTVGAAKSLSGVEGAEDGSAPASGAMDAVGGLIGGMGAEIKHNGLMAAVPAMAAMSFVNGEGGILSKTFNAAVTGAIMMLIVKVLENAGVKLPGIDLGNLAEGFNRAAVGETPNSAPHAGPIVPGYKGPLTSGPA